MDASDHTFIDKTLDQRHTGSIGRHRSLSESSACAKGMGNETFNMQKRQVDAMKATIPPSTISRNLYNQSGRSSIDRNGSFGDVLHDKGNIKRVSKGAKWPKPFPKHNVEDAVQHSSLNCGNDKSNSVRKDDNEAQKTTQDCSDDGSNVHSTQTGVDLKRQQSTNVARTYSSNLLNGKQKSRLPYMQVHGGFRSLRRHPRREHSKKTVSVAASQIKQKKSVRDVPRKQSHVQHALSDSDHLGFRSPSGAWYPHERAQAMMAENLRFYGPPHQLRPLPLAIPANAIALADSLQSLPLPSFSNVLPHGSIEDKTASSISSLSPVNIEQTLAMSPSPLAREISYPSCTQDIVDRCRDTFDIADAQHNNDFLCEQQIDPRPPRIRVQSIMATIASELEHLKWRMMHDVEHKTSPAEAARYLDVCICLCKHATEAASDLIKENHGLGAIPSKAGFKTKTSGVLTTPKNTGTELKIGRTTDSRNVSIKMTTSHNNLAISAQQPADTFASGMNTSFPSPLPACQAYDININPQSTQLIEDEGKDTAPKVPWWFSHNRDFLLSEDSDLTWEGGHPSIKRV